MSGQQAEKQDHDETAPRMSGNTISSNPARTESIKNEIALTANARQSSFGAETVINEEEPTDEERRTLRRIGDSLPMSAWLVAIVELCERFSYYGCVGLFQNYVQRPLDGSLGRGALGLGHRTATALTVFFSMWCYFTPIFGAIVADQYLGRFKAICYFAIVYMVGLLVLVLTSLPISLENGAGLGGFIAAILIIGVGTGGIKSNVSPLIADQYTRKRMAIKVLENGERVIIDPTVTVQRIYLIFYWCINIGALSLLATPYMERDIGFWSAFLLCLCVFLVGFATLLLGRKRYVVRPPKGTVITDAFKVIGTMIKYRKLDAAKPSYQTANGIPQSTQWNDQFVEEVKRALIACRVFVFYPIYWVVYAQFSSNFVSQAGEMNTHGVPNDLSQNFDPIAIILLVPVMDRFVYPLFRKLHIKFRPISRITFGFIVASLSMMYAAIVQHLIYKAGPCYGKPLECPAAILPDGTIQPNDVHFAIQIPAYIFIGVSEIFASVTGLEYAYTKAPVSMKSFVQAMFLLTNAFGFALCQAFIPLVGNPTILWMFVGLACGSFGAGIVFYICYHKLDDQEDELNSLDAKAEELELRGSDNGNTRDM
ncbi:18466f3b-73ad-4fcf-8272-7ef0a4ee24b0 [Sclerotinia trifoliorum]|uniref:18466f3b-73ad-4fcf-8272-7ef0a4ee24b0 n=1 Tax=Sclerotinia trifoliorum TaxID=28548 RepID=A0A8H2ZQY5_9HELO|nr:18466f3b-73ad-4fcf-8272-7ef0a4ee24b0 [Sclerotinia trifoliorum]